MPSLSLFLSLVVVVVWVISETGDINRRDRRLTSKRGVGSVVNISEYRFKDVQSLGVSFEECISVQLDFLSFLEGIKERD